MYDKQQTELAHMQAFVDKFRYKATKAKQAQSRLKAMERMEKIVLAQADSPFSFSFFENEKRPPAQPHSHGQFNCRLSRQNRTNLH